VKLIFTSRIRGAIVLLFRMPLQAFAELGRGTTLILPMNNCSVLHSGLRCPVTSFYTFLIENCSHLVFDKHMF
jgi:hypothetical protein